MHISFIMDGNGRWAQSRGLPRSAGHRAGGKTLRKMVTALAQLGIEEATFYAFSTENWNRPKSEVSLLLLLLEEYLKTQVKDVHRQNGVFRMIGSRDVLSDQLLHLIEDAEKLTCNNTGIKMNIAFNYGGRAEILHAVKRLVNEVCSGETDLRDLSEERFQSYLHLTSDPDLLIRTGGEQRLSNYLLWQHSYSELMFLDVLWPDFNEDMLKACIQEFYKRNRRFGMVEQQ